jgi:hypothetical protein
MYVLCTSLRIRWWRVFFCVFSRWDVRFSHPVTNARYNVCPAYEASSLNFLLTSNYLLEVICFDEVRLLTFHLLLMCFLELRCVFLGSWCRGHRLHFRCSSRHCLRLSSSRRLNVSPLCLCLWRLFVDWVWMTGYIPYFSEIHAQILKLHTTYVPTDYRSLLLFLLQPVIWRQKGGVPRSRYHSMAIILSYINDAWGTGWLCKNNMYVDVSISFVINCDRVLIDVIQCEPATIFSGNHLCACRRTGLTHMFTYLHISYYSLWRTKLTTSLWIFHRCRWGNAILVSLFFLICVVRYWWGAVGKSSTTSSWAFT